MVEINAGAQASEWRDVSLTLDEDFRLDGRSIALRLAEISDADFIVGLRTDPVKNAFLSKTPSDVDAQRRWLTAYKARESKGTEFYFIIQDASDSPCGVVRVYGVHEKTFTWGSWILADNAPRKAAIESALLIYLFAFEMLGLELCVFDVRLGNSKTLAFHDRFGATRTHKSKIDQHFKYTKGDWLMAKAGYAQFLPDLS